MIEVLVQICPTKPGGWVAHHESEPLNLAEVQKTLFGWRGNTVGQGGRREDRHFVSVR